MSNSTISSETPATMKSKEQFYSTIPGRRHRQRPRMILPFYHSPLSILALTIMLFSWTINGIGVCRFNKCTPNCICDYQFDDMCAMEYGNFGWRVPPTAKEYVWRYMRPDTPISTHEIKPVGMAKETQRLSGIGYANGKIMGIDQTNGITGHVYFEVHPDHLMKSNDIVVELYGGINLGFSDCAEEGTLLGRTGPIGFSAQAFAFPSYNDNYQDEKVPVECHPRFTGAIVGAAEFTITNPFDAINTVWYPQENQPNTGDLQYCVRVRVQPKGLPPMPNTEDKYHYIDTKFKIKGDRTKEYFARGNDIRIYTNQEFASKDAYVKANNVGVRAFLCGLPTEDAVVQRTQVAEDLAGIHITKAKRFGIGQEFTICVGPDENSWNDYEVVGFEDVICENDGQSRTIVTKGDPDIITVIDASTVGHIDYDMVAAGAANGGMIEQPGNLGIRTAVTTGWLQREDRLVTCTGVAKIEERKIALNNRYLRNNNKDDRRHLESLERQERGSVSDFSIQIGVNNSTVFSRGEVPYPDDGKSSGCQKCKNSFLAFGILFLLVGGGGMAGWYWYTYYDGKDVIFRYRERYSQCGAGGKGGGGGKDFLAKCREKFGQATGGSGKDFIGKCRDRYGTGSNDDMLEEICAEKSDHRRVRKPFVDLTSSDDDDPVDFSDEEKSVDDCYKEDGNIDDDDDIATSFNDSLFSDENMGFYDRDESEKKKKKSSRSSTEERSDRSRTKKSKKSKKSKSRTNR